MILDASPIDTPFDLTLRATARTVMVAAERRIERAEPPGTVPGADARQRAAAADPVVLVPGYGATGRSWSAIARGLQRDGFRVHVFEPRGFALGGIEPLARDLDAFVGGVLGASEGARRVQVVGHSKGGLIAAAWLRDAVEAGRDLRASRFVTLGTPSHGLPPTRRSNPALGAALLLGGPSSSAILQTEEGPWIARLDAAGLARRIPTTTIFSRTSDGLVPAAAARIDGARNVELEHGPSHLQLLTDGPAYAALRDALLRE